MALFLSYGSQLLRSPMTTEPEWLVELHSKLWNRQDLRPDLFREVAITVELYHTFLERLKELHPDRDTPNYNATATEVLSTKLRSLASFISLSLSEQLPRSGNDPVEND